MQQLYENEPGLENRKSIIVTIFQYIQIYRLSVEQGFTISAIQDFGHGVFSQADFVAEARDALLMNKSG